jgi:hypothetical protein
MKSISLLVSVFLPKFFVSTQAPGWSQTGRLSGIQACYLIKGNMMVIIRVPNFHLLQYLWVVLSRANPVPGTYDETSGS